MGITVGQHRALFFVYLLIHCTFPACAQAADDYSLLQNLLMKKNADGVITLPAGNFQLKRSLTLTQDNVHLKGQGIGKTILNFGGQVSGSEGIRVSGKNIVLSDFSLYETPGDGIKAIDSENITFKHLEVGWKHGASNKQGTYAIYPVASKNILIEHCETFGATEAGIYVGQSTGSKVIHNYAYNNTVGIEAENSVDTVIADNRIIDNSLGVLISDIPGLPMFGKNTHILRNEIRNNNRANDIDNKAHLGYNQNGAGVVLVATKSVLVDQNHFSAHLITDIAVLHYHSTNFRRSRVLYDPNVRDIQIGSNHHKAIAQPTSNVRHAFYKWVVPDASRTLLWDGRISQDKLYAPLSNWQHLCLKELLHDGRIVEGEGNTTKLKSLKDADLLCRNTI